MLPSNKAGNYTTTATCRDTRNRLRKELVKTIVVTRSHDAIFCKLTSLVWVFVFKSEHGRLLPKPHGLYDLPCTVQLPEVRARTSMSYVMSVWCMYVCLFVLESDWWVMTGLMDWLMEMMIKHELVVWIFEQTVILTVRLKSITPNVYVK